MKIKSIKAKTVYIIIVIIFFIAPLLFMIIPDPCKKHMQLVGVVKDSHVSKLSVKNWCDNCFQKTLSQKFSEKFGFRDFFIRLNNQIYYSLFKKSYAEERIIIAKDNFLFLRSYIETYVMDFNAVKRVELEKVLIQAKILQDKLNKNGITFLIAITPSKAALYPEYLPELAVFQRKSGTTNSYDAIIPLLNKYNLNYIDGYKIVKDKKTNKLPVFCKGSIHWNYLGAYYFTEQLIQKIETLSGKKLTNLQLDRVDTDYKPEGSDKDLASLLNLLIPSDHYLTPHPIISNIPNKTGYKPNIALIGGSFAEIPMDIMTKNSITDRIDYYAYYKLNHIIYSKDGVKLLGPIEPYNINWNKDIFSKDIIILEINTEALFSSKHYKTFVADALANLK